MIVRAHQCNGCRALSRDLPSSWTTLDEITHYCAREECRRKMRVAVMARRAKEKPCRS